MELTSVTGTRYYLVAISIMDIMEITSDGKSIGLDRIASHREVSREFVEAQRFENFNLAIDRVSRGAAKSFIVGIIWAKPSTPP